jgi:hypothetical protein
MNCTFVVIPMDVLRPVSSLEQLYAQGQQTPA